MTGEFFPKEEKPVKVKRTTSCETCKLKEQCVSPQLNSIGGDFGQGKKGVLILSGTPSLEEDAAGISGKGKGYTFLREALRSIDIFIREDCWYVPVIGCRPYKGTEPKHAEISACRERVLEIISVLKPKKIILMGELPFRTLIYPRLTGRIGGTEWAMFIGEQIPDQELGTFLCPIEDPLFLLSTKTYGDGGKSKPLYQRENGRFILWKQSLKNIFETSSTFYYSNYMGDCFYSENVNEAKKWIEDALSWNSLAFDYETSGIKPHREGHKIVCASISNGLFAYAFPFFEDKEFRRAWKRLMLSSVKKIAHNIQFENVWTHFLLGYWVENWEADTMLLGHANKNEKPNNLKYLTYVNFGDIGYDDSIDKYLKPTNEEEAKYGANAFNQIDKAPMNELLLYNALDSLYTHKLYQMYQDKFTIEQRAGNRFFLESAITLSKVQENGFCINTGIFSKGIEDLNDKMKVTLEKIENSPETKLWDGEEPFNFNSSQQLGHLLFSVLNITPVAFTKQGRPSVDKENLPKYDTPIVKDILAWRKLEKIRQSLDKYLVEQVDGKLYASIGLGRVNTFRSSCSDPNLQQAFKRDKEAKRLIRLGLVPRPGHRIIETDHGQLEVRINACYSGDKNLLKYITQGLDMHTESTMDCFMLTREQVKKEYRNEIKGGFVFAEFYGSYYKQVATDLWEFVTETEELREHLAQKGIKVYTQFEEKIEEAERILWEERFPEHNQWRKDMWKFYNTYGYIETFTGFRLNGPMNRNNSFNGQVQGSAYHILQQGMNWVQQEIEEKQMDAKLLVEIHDALVADVLPAEEALYDTIVARNCMDRVKEKWPWIIVPFVMEKERSAVDGNWAEMEKCIQA